MGKTDLAALERALEAALEKLSTDRKRAFVREYPIDLNLTKAAERAGYSAKSARQEGSRLLSNAAIQDAIALALEVRSARTQITADRVLEELAKLAFSDLRKVFDKKGGLLPPDEWPPEIAASISSIEVDELFEGLGQERTQVGYTKKVRLWDKNSAIDKIGRHLKLWGGDQISINMLQNIPDSELDARIEALLKKQTHAAPEPKPKSGAPVPPRGARAPGKA